MFADNISLYLLTIFALSFALCTAAVLIFSQIARSNNILLDNPTERKRHVGMVPLVGGLAIFVTYSIYSLIYGSSGPLAALYLGSLWLMLVGLADDIVELSSGFRLLAQITAALLIIYFGEAHIYSLGNITGGAEIKFERISLAFSIMCILGVVNSINMIDGIDGLSSGITLLTILALLVISISSVGLDMSLLMVTLLGSLFAFFLFNIGYYGVSRKVFMGDAGSTVLGFILAWMFIVLSQTGSKPLSPAVAGWLFGLPLLDSISVMMRRVVRAQSPLKADRNHLHHQLMAHGLSARVTLVFMLLMHAVMLCVGVVFNGVVGAEPYLFGAFVVLVLVRHSVFGWNIRRTA